jgi:SAM-dependent methyltransferase
MAGDADYTAIGVDYVKFRRPDPRIAARVVAALGDARTVLNVGAGAGSYEPIGREVTAVEPSATMLAQRPAHLRAAIDATAEDLPFADGVFDAAMTTFSVHQWQALDRGLAELRRVTTGPIVILTGDPERVETFWLADYVPAVLAVESRRYPTIQAIADALGGTTTAVDVPIPLDCSDGFNEAYYGRPELLLDPDARRACSAWSFVAQSETAAGVEALRRALADGSWDAKYGSLRTQPSYVGSLVLIVNQANVAATDTGQ